MTEALLPVLVTDDSPDSRDILCLILNRFGIPAIEAKTPAEALHMCQTQPIALVVSDIVKPDMDGYELLARLHGDPITQHIPLMFVSSTLGIRAGNEKALSLGAVRCMSKPVLPREFAAEVRAVLAERGLFYPEPIRLAKRI